MTEGHLGRRLVVVSVVAFLATVSISAALAPPVTTEPAAEEGNRTLVSVHGAGAVVMYNDSQVEWRIAENVAYFGATMLDNGSVVAGTAIKGVEDCEQYESPCTRTGFQVIDPSPEPEVVYEWLFLAPGEIDNEVHDVEVIPDGRYLVLDMVGERLVLLEPGTGITWQWNASSHYDAPEDHEHEDWLHANDVDRIEEGRYLVSIRNENQLLIVDREEGVVEVINEDGSDEIMHRQHNPQWLGDGRVLVADSGNDRIVELKRDEQSGRWHVVWELHEAGGIKFDWPRDADRLTNGNTLITDTRNNRVVEVDRDGDVVWSVSTRRWPYEADRLPEGETVGGLSTIGQGTAAENRSSSIPVLSSGLVLLGYLVRLPHWFKEPQLAFVLVELVAFVVGVALSVRRRSTG